MGLESKYYAEFTVDWYFWLPLYASASIVSFMHTLAPKKYPLWTILTLLFGILLFFKVIIEAIEMDALFSMDMQQRIVREKWGSFLVAYAMALQLQSVLNTKTSKLHFLGITCIFLFFFMHVMWGMFVAFVTW